MVLWVPATTAAKQGSLVRQMKVAVACEITISGPSTTTGGVWSGSESVWKL